MRNLTSSEAEMERPRQPILSARESGQQPIPRGWGPAPFVRCARPGEKSLAVWLGTWIIAGLCFPVAAVATELTGFGFTGPETFPIDPVISELRAADLDGDGLVDLVIANNGRSKINLLYNQTGQTNPPSVREAIRRELNELPPDARFRIDSIASEKRIAALAVADLNGDRRPDLAYFGEPKELVVQYNQGTNGWSPPRRWPMEEGQLSPNALATGDLNGDGLTDLFLLGESGIHGFRQQADHSLGEPEKIPFSGIVKSAQVLDINGDGRDDLLLVNWESQNPFRFRLQGSDGDLGPEIHFNLMPVRSYTADDLDGDHRTEIITVAMHSGRAQISHFVRQPAAPLAGAFHTGQLHILPFNRTAKSRRGVAWADVNGDQRPDLLAAEPDSGQLAIYLQQADGTLAAGRTFATLTGVSEIAVGAGSGQTGPDIFLLSPDERLVGVTRLDDQGRVPFPTTIPAEGKPLAMAVGPMKPGAEPTLAVILDQEGKRFLLTRAAGDRTRLQRLSDNFKSNPASMVWHDANQDGLADLVILIPYEKIKILLQATGKDFEEQDVAAPGGTVEQPWLSVADVDGDGREELLLAQRNFLRAVVLKAESGSGNGTNMTWGFAVKDQINGASSSSRIVGAAPLRNGTNAVPSLFLLDAQRKAVTLCERDRHAVWQVVRNVPLPWAEFDALQPLALGASRPNSVAFVTRDAVAWMALAGEVWQFEELDGYETPIRNGHLHDVVTGDLNQDGRKDLVFLETARNYLDVVIFDPSGRLVPAVRWPVFEERSTRGRRSSQPEPREALIADVTGDGRKDLVVLVHDRILVYPQE